MAASAQLPRLGDSNIFAQSHAAEKFSTSNLSAPRQAPRKAKAQRNQVSRQVRSEIHS
jgi:hypothetical protein